MHARLVLARCVGRSTERVVALCAIRRPARGDPGVEAEERGEVEGEEGYEGVGGFGEGGCAGKC